MKKPEPEVPGWMVRDQDIGLYRVTVRIAGYTDIDNVLLVAADDQHGAEAIALRTAADAIELLMPHDDLVYELSQAGVFSVVMVEALDPPVLSEDDRSAPDDDDQDEPTVGEVIEGCLREHFQKEATRDRFVAWAKSPEIYGEDIASDDPLAKLRGVIEKWKEDNLDRFLAEWGAIAGRTVTRDEFDALVKANRGS